jgi:DNA-binding SARP family transcriptional activator
MTPVDFDDASFCARVEAVFSSRRIAFDPRLATDADAVLAPGSGHRPGPAALAAYAVASIMAPGAPEALARERSAAAALEQPGSEPLLLAFAALAVFRALWGDGSPAEIAANVDRAVELARDARLPAGIRRAWHLAEAQYRYVTGEAFEPALGRAAQVERGETGAEAHFASVYPFAPTGTPAPMTPYDRWWLHLAAVAQALALGEARSAIDSAALAEAAAAETDLPVAIGWSAAAAALAALAGGARVMPHLGESRRMARRHRLDLLLALGRGVAALRAAKRGSARRAAALAADAGRRMRRLGAGRLPLLPDPLARALAPFLAADAGAAARGPRTRIRTLGGFEIVRDGDVLAWPRKAPRRPLDLLKALIALGGRNVPVPRLVDALWPEDDSQGAQSFATALHRLRKIVGDEAVQQSEGRVSIDAASVWVDAIAFESRSDDPADYRGEFLPGEDAPWALSARERLRDRHRRAAGARADAALAADDWRRAFELCLAALERDPLAEALAQTALRACARGGLRSEAAAVYERLRRAVGDSLGLGPSRRTEELYREAIRG